MRCLLSIVFAFALISAQGIRWESGTLQQVLDSSSQIVFVDCYTQTCPPCKMMLAKIFPTKEAGDYFNANFTNIKLDLGAPENIWIAEKYDVSTFPTFLFLSPDGSELCRIVGASDTPGQFIARVEHAMDPANRVEVLLNNFISTNNPEFLFQYLQRLQKEGQYRRLREYVINSYDKLSTTAISSNAVASGNIVTDLRFWKYIKIAINLQDLSVLEKVLANKSEFDKTIGKAKIEKDLYNDLRYELNLYRRKGGNHPPANIQRAESIIQMFDPNRTTGSN